jgi:hypothetical protein
MHVYVHSILSRGSTDVHADAVPIGRMIRGNPALRAIEKRLYFNLFRHSHIEVARDVPPRDHEDVATAQTVVVVPNVRERAFQQKVLWPAQLAILSGHGFNPASIIWLNAFNNTGRRFTPQAREEIVTPRVICR